MGLIVSANVYILDINYWLKIILDWTHKAHSDPCQSSGIILFFMRVFKFSYSVLMCNFRNMPWSNIAKLIQKSKKPKKCQGGILMAVFRSGQVPLVIVDCSSQGDPPPDRKANWCISRWDTYDCNRKRSWKAEHTQTHTHTPSKLSVSLCWNPADLCWHHDCFLD